MVHGGSLGVWEQHSSNIIGYVGTFASNHGITAVPMYLVNLHMSIR